MRPAKQTLWLAIGMLTWLLVAPCQPALAGPLFDKGRSLYEADSCKKATKLLAKSFKTETDSRSDAAILLGACYEEMDKPDRAIGALKKGRDKDPENWTILFKLGELQEMRGDLFGSLESFIRASQVKPDDLDTTFRLGMMYDSTAQMEKALKEYRKLKQAKSPHAARLLNAIQGIE